MKRSCLLVIITIALVFAACKSQKNSTGIWVNKEKVKDKSYQNIFIVVMTADVEVRSKVETDLATMITSKGFKAIRSSDVMPGSVKDPRKPTKEEIVGKVKENGCDGVFVAALFKKGEDIGYVPEKNAYMTVPYNNYVGGYYGYYTNYYSTVSEPGYYQVNKQYFIHSNFYDAASEEIMFTVQSDVFNPATLDKFSKMYIGSLVKQLEAEKIIKKK